jgi:hypothetical protein
MQYAPTIKNKPMTYNPQKHHRRSIRLKGYDYSQAGLYFITMVTQNRACLFGEIENGVMILNQYGQIAYDEWAKTPEIRNNIELCDFVIMPNHIHGIVRLLGANRIRPITRAYAIRPITRGVCDSDNKGVCDTPDNAYAIRPITRAYAIRPYDHHRKPLVQLCVDINHRLQNNLDYWDSTKKYGNAIIGNTLSAMKNRT